MINFTILLVSGITLLPLPAIKRLTPRLGLECDHTPFREIEHISRLGFHFITRFIAQRRRPFNDNLHFVIVVRVDELMTGLEMVDAASDGLFGVC